MLESARILILDDDVNLRKTLTDILKIKGFQPIPLSTGSEALERVQAEDIAVALVDLRLEDMPGLDVLRGIRERSPDTECLLVTGHASQATAIEAINLGAYSYVQKPFDVDQLFITIRNAVEKRQVGRALKENEARYRSLFEDFPISLWEEDYTFVKRELEALRRQGVIDVRSYFTEHPEFIDEYIKHINVLDVNNATLKLMHAVTKGELLGSLSKITRSGSSAGFLDEFVRIANGETEFEWEGANHTLDGDELIVSLHWTAAPGYKESLGKVVVSLIDITERKRAEQALREREFFFKESQTAAYVGSYKTDFVTGFWESSEVLDNIFGINKEYVRSVSGWLDIIHPDERDSMDRYLQGEVISKHQPFNKEYRIVRKSDGVTRWVLGQGQVAFDDKGEILSMIGTIQDITDRKNAEEALRLSEERFRTVFENVSIGIYRTTPDGRILLVNPALCHMLGYDLFEELAKRNLEEDGFNPEYSRSQFRQRMEKEGQVVGLESYWKTRDGKEISVRESARVIHADKEIYYEGTAEDITESKLAQLRLAQQTEELRRQNEELTRLNDQAERRMQRLVSMRTIDMAISGSFDVGIVLGIVLDQITGQLGTDSADILLFNPNGQTFKFASGRGFRTQGLERSQYQFGTDLTWRLIRERHKVEIPDLKAQPNLLQRTPDLSGESFVSYIGVPLMSKGQIQGVLEVFEREPRQRDQEWHGYLDTLAGQAAIAIDNAQLFDHLQNSNTELVMAYDSTLAGWASALELRDKETEGHAHRVASFTTQLAHTMGLSEDEQVQIYRGALLHDIGKMGIPDSIVLKPGKLTEEEWVIMRKHPQFAFDMLAPIAYLRPALDIPHCHHEKWDGTGYPRNLKGDNIPLAARLFAVVDVWDAPTSDRPYRKAWSEQEAIAYLRDQSGHHFDPAVVKAFLENPNLLRKSG